MSIDHKLFGKTIQVKRTGCNSGSAVGFPIPPSVNLFVKTTDRCNAHCAFCSNGCNKAAALNFDTSKLFQCIDEILNNGIFLNRLNLTGGEPSVVPDIVHEIISRLKGNDHYNRIHLHLNTNGLSHTAYELMKQPRIDSISLSLHHYDRQRLASIYHCIIPDHFGHFDGVDLSKVNLSCNLIKGFIDSTQEVKKMLDHTIDLGIPRIGFVALMPVNAYCREHFVDLEDITIEKIPHLYFTKSKNRGMNCKCSNFLYNRDAKILEIYMRNYMNPAYCESSLLYDGQHLRQGFHDDNIIY